MKKISLFSFIILVVCIFNANAQEIPIPDFTKRPFVLNEDNILTDFERNVAVIDYKIKGLGYGGSEIYYSVTPARSLVRYPLSNLPRFIIRTEPNQDPSEVIYLSKAFEVNSKRRRFITSKLTLFAKSKEIDSQFIQIDFKKLADDTYQIIIVDPIGNGEYAFIPFDTGGSATNMGGKVFINCFGIN
jgi:hypothetical protein